MTRWAWALVAGVTLGIWAPVVRYNWAYTWDDTLLFLMNPKFLNWDWTWVLTSQALGHWMPLTWVTARATYLVFGFNPMAWHAVNVALHALSAVLVYFIARRLIRSTWGAVFAALLFSVHPLRIESVAWISELKDCLMGVLFLGAVLLWLQGRMGWAFLAFVAACMSKSPAVVLPAMLLALEWYAARRLGERLRAALAWQLAPFFAVSAAVSAQAFYGLTTIPSKMPWDVLPLGPRLLHVAYSNVFYAMQTLWPHRLSNLIEYTWLPSWDQPQYPIAVAVVVVSAVLLLLTRRRRPALAAATIAYAIAVFPQAGLFANGPQLVANRYSYLACIPFALLAGAGIAMASRRLPRLLVVAGASAILVALAVVTLFNQPMWRDSDALWQYSALHEPTCTQCQDMATGADLRHGDFDSALRHQRQAIRVSDTTRVPRWERHWNLAAILLHMGRRDEAMAELRLYLAVVPGYRREMPVDIKHMESARETLATLELKGAL